MELTDFGDRYIAAHPSPQEVGVVDRRAPLCHVQQRSLEGGLRVSQLPHNHCEFSIYTLCVDAQPCPPPFDCVSHHSRSSGRYRHRADRQQLHGVSH